MTGKPMQAGYSYSRGWRRFTKIVLPPLIRLLMGRDWHGHENVPREGGVILAPNHLSYADWPAVALFSYEAGRYPVFLIKSPVFGVPVVGQLLRKFGQLPVYRGQTDAALVLKEAEVALKSGACVIFYAEGTATRDPDLWPMVARTGVARAALTTGAPVIPIAHWGAQHILPYGTKKLRLFPRTTVRLVAGPPVDLSEYRGKPLNSETLRGATAAVMRDVTALLAGLRGETPPDAPYDPRTARRLGAQAGASEADASKVDASQVGTSEAGASQAEASQAGEHGPAATGRTGEG
ncbi:MAG: lysophospholipid acyltransferase family protein [Micromonosporaceae bacterium]